MSWLTEGILIASVPVYVYILMLSFVIGYCDFFQIPISFISLNLSTMLWIGLRLELGLIFLVLFIVVMYVVLKLLHNKITEAILILVAYAGLLVLQIALRLPWRDWRWTLVLLAFFLTNTIIFGFLPSPSLHISPLVSNMLRRAFLVLPWLMVSVTVAMDMGRAEATNQRDYLVPASAPTTVVLSHFGETLVVAPFDRSTKEVEPSFWIIKIGEDPKLLLRWESVGPLHPKPEGGSTPSHPIAPSQLPGPSKP